MTSYLLSGTYERNGRNFDLEAEIHFGERTVLGWLFTGRLKESRRQQSTQAVGLLDIRREEVDLRMYFGEGNDARSIVAVRAGSVIGHYRGEWENRVNSSPLPLLAEARARALQSGTAALRERVYLRTGQSGEYKNMIILNVSTL